MLPILLAEEMGGLPIVFRLVAVATATLVSVIAALAGGASPSNSNSVNALTQLRTIKRLTQERHLLSDGFVSMKPGLYEVVVKPPRESPIERSLPERALLRIEDGLVLGHFSRSQQRPM